MATLHLPPAPFASTPAGFAVPLTPRLRRPAARDDDAATSPPHELPTKDAAGAWRVTSFIVSLSGNDSAHAADGGHTKTNAGTATEDDDAFADSADETDAITESGTGTGTASTDTLDQAGTRSFGDSDRNTGPGATAANASTAHAGSLTFAFHRETADTATASSVSTYTLDVTGSFATAAGPATFRIRVTGGSGSSTTAVTEAGTDLFAGQTPAVTADGGWLDGYLGSLQDAIRAQAGGAAGASGSSVNQVVVGPGATTAPGFPGQGFQPTVGATVVRTSGGTTRTEVLNAGGRVLSDVYTEAATGRVLQSHAYGYHAQGRKFAEADGGRETAWTYDDAGDKITETVSFGTPQAARTRVVYEGGNLVEVIDPDGNTTAYGYDAQGRVVSVTDALGHTLTKSYDAAGNVASITNRNGLRRGFADDAQNRETGETWYAADGTTATDHVEFAYNAAGQLVSAGNDAGTYNFSYDPQGRVSQVDGPFGVTLTYGYDAAGNRVLVQDSFGGTTTSQYDAANELVGRWFSQNGTPLLGITQQFNSNGQVAQQTRTAGDGTVIVTTAFGYDMAGNLTSLVHAGAGGTIASYAYSYDTSGSLASQSDGSATHNYGYDAAGELTSDNTQQTTFDANGNRTMAGYVTGPDNRLLSDGTWNYGFDGEGNVVTKTSIATGDTWAYGYDAKNRMVSAEHRDSSGALLLKARYNYDVYDHRISEIITVASGVATETRFAYDGNHLFALLDASNSLVKRYLSLDALDSAFARIGADGSVSWLLADRLGTIDNIVSNSGAVSDHIGYNAWGQKTNETQPANGDELGFAGYWNEVTVGLYQVWERWYDATTGRWWQKDPKSFAAGDSDLYRYVGNEATNATDPTGLQSNPQGPSGSAGGYVYPSQYRQPSYRYSGGPYGGPVVPYSYYGPRSGYGISTFKPPTAPKPPVMTALTPELARRNQLIAAWIDAAPDALESQRRQRPDAILEYVRNGYEMTTSEQWMHFGRPGGGFDQGMAILGSGVPGSPVSKAAGAKTKPSTKVPLPRGRNGIGTGPLNPTPRVPQNPLPTTPRPGRMHVEPVELSTGKGRDFVIPGSSVEYRFEARLMDGSDTLQVAWTDNLRQTPGRLGQAQQLAGGPRSFSRITGRASVDLEAAMRAGRFNAAQAAQQLGNSLGGRWRVDVTRVPGSQPPVFDITATRIGN